jgi:hypothetical protein
MRNIAYYFVKYNVLLILFFLIDKYVLKMENLSLVRAVGIVTIVALYDIIMFSIRKYKRLKKK